MGLEALAVEIPGAGDSLLEGFATIVEIRRPAEIPAAIVTLFGVDLATGVPTRSEPSPALEAFADRVAFQPFVPLSASPCKGTRSPM